MAKTTLAIEWISTQQLAPYLNNPKEHPAEQIKQIAASIEAFGFNDPIALDAENGIIEGHGRLLAAQQLGLKTVPIIRLAHLSEAEKKAYALAHNKLTLNTGWDMEKLQVEFETLRELDFEDLSLTGFQAEELTALFTDEDNHVPNDADSDEAKTEVTIHYQNQYGIIVQCEAETQQQRVYNELMEAGYDCKVVVV